MAVTVQFRRGTAAQNNAFTGAAGEISVNTTNNAIKRLSVIASCIASELKTSLNHLVDGPFLNGKVKKREGEKDIIPTQIRGIITKRTKQLVYNKNNNFFIF